MKHREVRVGNIYDCRAAMMPGLVEVTHQIQSTTRTTSGYRVKHIETGRVVNVDARHLHTVKTQQTLA